MMRWVRFIPVHTGNTPILCLLHRSTAVYPCAYREHYNFADRWGVNDGLSLCIQGTRWWLSGGCGDYSVYPCAYREHSNKILIFDYLVGLSLCIQGTRTCIGRCSLINRFIPVHTGNTFACFLINYSKPVYPCAYREHLFIYNAVICYSGLSLCIQGTL